MMKQNSNDSNDYEDIPDELIDSLFDAILADIHQDEEIEKMLGKEDPKNN